MRKTKTIHLAKDLHWMAGYEAHLRGTSIEVLVDELLRPTLSRHAEKMPELLRGTDPLPAPSDEALPR